MNRFVWDLRHPAVDSVPDAIVWGFTGGPRAVPGTYQATLRAGDWSESRSFRILPDPRLSTSQADFEEALDFMVEARSSLDETYDGIRRVRDLRSQVRIRPAHERSGSRRERARSGAADLLASKLTAIEEDLMQPKNEADQDVENFPTKLDNQLAYVYWLVDQADAPPTEGQKSRYEDLERDLAAVLERLEAAIDTDLAAFQSLAREKGATSILLPKPD
jgi:hypothetical protein